MNYLTEDKFKAVAEVIRPMPIEKTLNELVSIYDSHFKNPGGRRALDSVHIPAIEAVAAAVRAPLVDQIEKLETLAEFHAQKHADAVNRQVEIGDVYEGMLGEENEKTVLEKRFDQKDAELTSLRSQLEAARKALESCQTGIGEGLDGPTHEDFFKQALEAGSKAYDELRSEKNRLAKLVRLAQILVDKLKAIHEDPRYLGVWQWYAVHGCTYAGPQYDKEFEALDAALSKMGGS
jgi:hypothetical protein